MKLNPYLLFDGNCEAALQFYERALGAKTLSVMRYDGTPACAQMPGDMKSKVLHARFAVGEMVVMASDCPPDRYSKPQGCAVALVADKPAEAERLFQALAEGAQVTMPIEKTFFAERFGMLTDKFGIPWMVSCEQPA
ncbi:MAG TPA: VOC family protein [Stellaceae bacterium]|nr:VOC family protein [Stellaceae bacterium]